MTGIESPLPEHERTVTGEASPSSSSRGCPMQGALVDLIELSLIAKQAHWNIIGPRFRSIHFQLDDVVATARSYADTVAERASAIGVPPDGRATTVADTAGMMAPKAGWVQDSDAVELMTRCLADAVSRMRARIDLTDKTDLVSQDVLLGLTAKLEKHYWMFQAEQQNQVL